MSIQAYEQHGLSVSRSTKTQVTADCPFCGREGHWYANKETALWDCKACQQKGNLYTFLAKLYEAGLNQTKGKNALAPLAADRGLPTTSLVRAGICRHPLLPGTWLLPHYNSDGKIANLFLFTPAPQGNIPKIRGTADCVPHPFLPVPKALIRPGRNIFLAEGHWDAIAASLALGEEWTVLGVPGSGFREDWVERLAGTSVYVGTDNDPLNPKTGTRPGDQLLERIRNLVAPVSASFSSIAWERDKDPKDIRDVYTSYLFNGEGHPPYTVDAQIRTPAEAASLLKKFLFSRRTIETTAPTTVVTQNVSDKRPSVQAVKCTSLEALLKEFKKNYSLTGRLHSAIALTYAVHVALLIPGRMLWLYLIGGASTGKSTAVALLEDHQERNMPVDHFTGLSSGWRTRGKNPSLLSLMNGRTVTFKDWTGMLSLSPVEQERIMGEFRGVFDGYQNAFYRNQVVSQMDQINMNIVAATTPRVHANNRAELGERFLKYTISTGETRSIRRKRSNAAIQKYLSELAAKEPVKNTILPLPLRQASKGFCEHLFSTWGQSPLPEFNQEFIDRIIDLAELVSLTRVRVDRQGQDLIYRPVAEGESRLSEQLMKLATALHHVTRLPPEELYPVLRDVALDTGWGFPLEIAQVLHRNGEPLTKAQIAATLELPETTVWRHIQDMLEVKTLYKEKLKNSSGRGGSGVHYFHLSRDLEGILSRVIL